jgi:hypothetical protein
MGYASLLWIAPIAFYGFWSTGQALSYFFGDAKEAAAGFREVAFQPEPFPQAVFDWFSQEIVPQYFKPELARYYTIRAHILSSLVLGWLMILQAAPFIRHRWIELHRFVGKLIFPLMLVHWIVNGYVIFVIDLVNVGAWTAHYVKISWAVSLISYPLALYYINKKDIKNHRAWMIVTIACMFVVPVHRFLWIAISKNGLFGPYTTSEYYKEYIMGGSAVAALTINTLAGLYFGFVAVPKPKKPETKKA